mgnify:CR=1 FL=1
MVLIEQALGDDLPNRMSRREDLFDNWTLLELEPKVVDDVLAFLELGLQVEESVYLDLPVRE